MKVIRIHRHLTNVLYTFSQAPAVNRSLALSIAVTIACSSIPLFAQESALGAPVIAAHVKGPNQVNLTWPAVPNPGYGYRVEIQSAADQRFTAWTEMEPIPRAGGFTCDITIVMRDARCSASDPDGAQVHNPANRGIPYWVTEAQYVDPQDGAPAQFIAWSLKPNTAYSFRVRTYSGDTSTIYGTYSNTARVTTADYPVRYVSPLGNDSGDGTAPDPAHAWRTLAHGAAALACGHVLIVMAGSYPADQIRMEQKCSAAAKAVLLVNPGDTATLTSQPPRSGHALVLAGNYLVIDGLGLASPGTPYGEYDAEINGSHNALLNVDFHPPVVPSFKFGVVVQGTRNLVYRSYLHDYGSPDAAQNPSGNGGFVLALLGWGATENTIWSNHLTRGGHDESLCKSGCRYNRWLNNVMDGGWGQGWVSVSGADHNLVEGNFIQGVGQIAPVYKPAIQASTGNNTIRRNVVTGSKTWALEVSAIGGDNVSRNLIYNNVFYDSGGCYFQSSSRGPGAYNTIIYANNICYKIGDLATRIYLGNTTDRNTFNDILSVDAAGKPQPDRAFIMWNQLGAGAYETLRSVAAADRMYNPPFSRNRPVSVPPQFVDEPNLDFHLSAGSPLLGAGIAIVDAEWGSTSGPLDLGAFGVTISPAAPGPVPGDGSDPALRSARAGDFAAAAAAVRTQPSLMNALALEAALLRAAFDETAATDVLARIGTPAAGDLVARFERVRQGTPDPQLWDILAANPDRLLEMADTYIQWGLVRDAMVLLIHKYPQPVPALKNAVMSYYRSYCRDLLDYTYYASEDLWTAATLPLEGLSVRFPGALQVFQLMVQRDPTDANARYLLALAYQKAGSVLAAREALENALKLRPGFPDAEALLAKLPPAPVRDRIPPGAGPATGSVTPASATSSSPADVAAMALRVAATGDAGEALKYFTSARFPQEQQEASVREAYVELRLRRIVAQAAAHQCAPAIQGLSNLEAADKSLPFTSRGFPGFTRSLRVQYWVGVVEFACVDQNAARKRWQAVSKASPEIASADHAFPFMALAKLDPAESKLQARKALGFLQRQLDSASPQVRGILLYNQGLLLMLAGKIDDAAASFRAGADAGSPGFFEYLNLDAMRSLYATP